MKGIDASLSKVAEAVLETAHRFATQCNMSFVGTDALLLALVYSPGTAARRLLTDVLKLADYDVLASTLSEMPFDEKFKSEAITAALPLNSPGLTLWSRQPYAQHVAHQADYPMSYRFDETDSVLVCDRVKIPWERVFLHNDAAMSRRIYIETPANCYQNHQSNVRFWAKMQLIVGIASRICQEPC